MSDENKALVEKFINEVYNAGNTDAIQDLCVPGSMMAGGLVGQFMAMKSAFPDNHFTIETLIAEGDRVVAQMTVRGTNSGPMLGLPAFGKLDTPIPPTGKSVMTTDISIFKIADGRIASIATEFDQINLLRQLGWTFTPPGFA